MTPVDVDDPERGEAPGGPAGEDPGTLPAGEGRHHALELRDAAEAAFERGDYRRARALDDELQTVVGRADTEREGDVPAELGELAAGAARDRRQLGLDPLAVGVGLAATLLYLLGWLVAFW